MINEIVKNLQKGKSLLVDISQEQYCDKSIPPYYSSIGGHVRHILDMFQCIFTGYPNGVVDLTKRERNINVETFPSYGLEYLENIIQHLLNLKVSELDLSIEVVDDLGNGNCTVKSTLGAVLAQAQSHTIHHYATIGYMMHHLDICLHDDCFGLNPTTPKIKVLKN
ncbi:DinB family protein [Wenyingzhuangia sp. chi5]|uniref:DinB family protein n=1 Tax=Wenyingzhuangia gilva TaxID=3057677 RepID=A0ABT8VS12_9FLAO|nr:DinB family protein [Wenyingzhuangia sp. chi5]MDO3694753.1 DinB family protein [Wenyingzhuangia sp. chi5]